ncbi:MAG: hypothetical protein K8J08_03410 [Thermoanaerobaculia bacterium]|nr:hypothetical protein [Thermoanaerobaculia bacterium]
MKVIAVAPILLATVLLAAAASGHPSATNKDDTNSSLTTRHLFYLHGSIVEGDDPRPVHPQLGVYDYPAIVAAFEEAGFNVHSEQRPAGTSVDDYAAQLAGDIQKLLDGGVSPTSVIVAGHSKGGVIALRASARLDAPGVGWVLLAACFPSLDADFEIPSPALSLLDSADTLAVSCRPWMKGHEQAEILYATGRGHGLFYRPEAKWIQDIVEWRPDLTAPGLPAAKH